MPLAKTAPQPVAEKPVSSVQPPDTISRLDIAGVPVDIYNYFGVSLNTGEREVNKLKVITDWAKSETEGGTDGDMMLKISQLERHLGSPDGLQKRYDKLFNYCKMAMYSKELNKKMEALRRRF